MTEPLYEVSVHRGILGYAWTVYRNGRPIAVCDRWWLRLFYRHRSDAVSAAHAFAHNDHIRIEGRV